MSPLSKTSQRTDEELMVRAQADDTEAFAQLYDRHATRAFRVARAVCSDTSRAEDVVQEGFLAIWRSRARFQPQTGTFQAWSMKIVHNRAIDASRHAASRPPLQKADWEGREPPDIRSSPASPQDEVMARSERKALLASLGRLPEAQAEVIVLAFYGELSHSEIAAQLNLPAGTVKGRMRLGLEKLRAEISAPGERDSLVQPEDQRFDRERS
jgi:RNA polymerase sigma-70 factor (ECF subfamily)